jgi:hypothetical protein
MIMNGQRKLNQHKVNPLISSVRFNLLILALAIIIGGADWLSRNNVAVNLNS